MPKVLYSKWFKIFLLLIIAFFGYKFYNNYQHLNQLEDKIEQIKNEIAAEEEKKENLAVELENINNPEYIEIIARKELGLVKPGEVLIIPIEEKEEK
ncbi:MAG: FtsB family cell division protein [Halanaerobiaceae bacterium]